MSDSYIHGWFGLSYSNYLVLNRTLLQSMPQDWQGKFVDLLEEMQEAFKHVEQPDAYIVKAARTKPLNEMLRNERKLGGYSSSLDYNDEPKRWHYDSSDEYEKEYDRWEESEVFYDEDGQELEGWQEGLIPVEDPIPHYNRGRAYIEPNIPPKYEHEPEDRFCPECQDNMPTVWDRCLECGSAT